MPNVDGLQAAAELAADGLRRPVVVVTGVDDPSLVERSIASGVSAYLTKPVDTRELEAALVLAAARHAELEALEAEVDRAQQALEDRKMVERFALAATAATSGAKVDLAASRLGRILVDAKGLTLYDFPSDKGTTSVCYGACAALWPPLLTTGKPVAGPGVRASLLGTTKRKDGKLEVTYNGHPLYYFVTDRKPGQATGQGVHQFGGPWWVLSPARKEIHRG